MLNWRIQTTLQNNNLHPLLNIVYASVELVERCVSICFENVLTIYALSVDWGTAFHI